MTNAKTSLNCTNRSFSEWFYKLFQTQQLPSTTPLQSTSTVTGVIQNISVILLGSEEIPHLSARDTSHITRARADTALPTSTSKHWARPPSDCQSRNGERSSKNWAETTLAKQLCTSYSSRKMQRCKVSTGNGRFLLNPKSTWKDDLKLVCPQGILHHLWTSHT